MDAKLMASQLRKPEGETGVNVGITMNKGNAFMNDLVFSKVNLQDNEVILEIGFGNGKLIPQLLNGRKNVRYEGIDYSETMVSEALIFNKELIESGTVGIRQGNFTALPFADNFFDKICTINTIYFLDDLSAGIQELFRVLKPGGSVYIGARPPETAQILEFAKDGFTFYTGEQVVAMLEKAGFKNCGFEMHTDPLTVFQDKQFYLKTMCIWGAK
jgi:SAM-dependent methyltransferase